MPRERTSTNRTRRDARGVTRRYEVWLTDIEHDAMVAKLGHEPTSADIRTLALRGTKGRRERWAE